jgi:hypothetical protein
LPRAVFGIGDLIASLEFFVSGGLKNRRPLQWPVNSLTSFELLTLRCCCVMSWRGISHKGN